MILKAAIFFLSLSALASPDVAPAEGEGSLRMPMELAKSQIVDKAGAKIPLDIVMTDHNGKQVVLGDYLKGSKVPVIVNLGFYGCDMLCGLVLNGLTKGLKEVSFKPGRDYRIVTLSIDENETSELAAQKRKTYLAVMDYKEDVDWWSFHTAKASEIDRFTKALGFNFYKDKKTGQFAHGAGFFVMAPADEDATFAILSRTLFGIEFKPGDIKLALSEAADGKIGSFVDQLILSCFHYDPDSHRYGVYIFGVMRVGGLLTVLILAVMLLMYFRGERKREDFVV